MTFAKSDFVEEHPLLVSSVLHPSSAKSGYAHAPHS